MRKGLLLINQKVKTRFIEGDVSVYKKHEVIGWEIRQTGDLKKMFFIPSEAIENDFLDMTIAEKGLYNFVTVFNRYVIGEGSVRKTLLEEYSKISVLFDDETIDNLFEFIKEYVEEDDE